MADFETRELRDGRTLAFTEFGAPDGRPVLYFHGFPGSRLEARLSADTAAKVGARVIAIDRPGFGRSSPKPGRRLLDWPDDVVELADSLGLPRFAVMGVSGGGPYAAACAYRVPERLTGVAIVCGVGPFDVPDARRGMMPMNRILFGVSRYSTTIPGLFFRLARRGLLRDPARAMERMSRGLPEVDRQAMARPEIRDSFAATALEALRQGSRNAAHESQLYARPWGFRLQDISCEVHVYQGELDRNVPPTMGRYQASALPNSRPHFYPDQGHLSLALDRQEEILKTLVGA